MTDRFVWRRLWQAWLLCFLQAAPVSAAGSEREFSSISCGTDYTLAVTTDGTPITWGFPLSERPKVYVPQGFLWQELFAGTSHSCGIINTGETLCWGRTREGQCDVPRGYSFVDLTLGEAFTCGLTANAELLCWGSSLDFELQVPPGNTWLQADAGTVHTCAVNTTGQMHCWGKQGYGRQAIPYQENGDVTWEAVACGDRHCCGIAAQTSLQALSLRQEDNVICWGDDSELQLQVPGKDQGRSGVQETFSSISAGNFHTCGLTLGMDVWCWGRVNLYRLDFRTPSNATMLSSGGIHACILDINQKARCWGGDNVGQAGVPLDSATYPPSILDYSNDPLDINGEDPSMRIYEYVPGYSTPLRTKQHVNMAIFFPEFALTDSATLTFTHVDGSEDPYSPHVIQFPDSWNAPVINELNISAFDLSHWYDLRLGPSPAIRNITSTYVNGSTQHQLVDGGAYSVVLRYQDSFGHPPAIHWLQRYEVSYDLETLPPTLIEPVPGFTKQALRVSYTLQEDMFPESVWLTMTFIGAFPGFGQQVQDTNSPYEIQLSQDLTHQGTYGFDLNLGELNADLAGRRSPYVRRVLTASGIGGPGTRLVTGGRYNATLRVADRYNNAPMFDQVSDIDFVWDIATEVTQLTEPTTVLNSPIVIEYTLTERALPGSLRFDIIWLRSLAPVPGMPSPKADPQSPHSFGVYPAKEQSSIDGTSSNILRLSPSNLFRDITDEALAHPDIRIFESKGTPVCSCLQPLSEYLLSISYQDLFENTRSYLNRTLQTNFTVPFTPQAPTLKSRTTNTLEVAWVRGFTGGMRISAYDLQLQMAPGPPTPWWNGTDAEAAADAASRATASIKDQLVLGQESSSTVFLSVLSSQHYLVRVRARNPIGASAWSDWTLLRVLSACPDGTAHDGEACDDGNTVNGDGCSSSCQVELGWTCEAASPGDFADGWGLGTSKCRAAGMDGLRVGDEECDDCNNQAGDGCDNGKVEPSYVCEYQGRLGIETGCVGVVAADTNLFITFTADSCNVVCGDGIRHVVAGEECDDGNLIDGDGCSRDCRIEAGFTCPTQGWPSVLLTPCQPICGDGLRVGDEDCDDNNTEPGDGCSSTCEVEIGWFCKRAGTGVGFEVCLQTCLNGIIDPGEDCDDANTFKNDGCANCILEPGWRCEPIQHRFTSTSSGSQCMPVCGDGFRIELGPAAEECDDGNNLAGDGCDPVCHVEVGWRTKVQADSSKLLLESICGDGLVVGSEGCDDGNLDAGDGCSTACKVEPGFACTPEDAMTKPEAAAGPPFAAQNRSICVPVCGDGVVLVGNGEECDDGNRVPNDGCDENCRVESGYACGIQSGATSSLTRSVCKPVCGDGLLRAPEECDDGNDGKGDGCDQLCKLEEGYRCWPPGAACRQLCGDYLRLEGEECDDGNLLLADGCDSSCHVEVGWTCRSYVYGPTNATSVCSPICGDGMINGAEACDDGNLVPGDGCDGTCQVEVDYVCCDPTPASSGSSCVPGLAADRELICGTPTCGNGRRDSGEGCDDANRVAGDGCGQFCQVEPGYACIPMAVQGPGRNVPDFCEAVCGDGLLVLGEECDDGNVATGDGCGPNCLLEQQGTSCPPASDGLGGVCRATCGDGVRGPVEECDDGNSVSGDGCSATCQVERGFTCSGGGLKSMDTCWPICGDGLRVDRTYAPTLAADKLEGCDTGPLPSRGCDASCQVRVGWRCARPQGQGEEVCVPVCGDGILSTPMEECDDMNLQSGDGCSPDCKVEAFFECTYDDFWLRSVCKVHCGDGRKHPSEACDDGNVWDEDGCSSNCEAEAGFECLGGALTLPSTCTPICGDGYEVFGEGCDDGNQNPWDGCDQFCQVEQGYHCTRAPKPGQTGAASACSPTCGDGLLNGEEECDGSYSPLPGNTTELPVPCSRCRLLAVDVCGDFRRGPTEQCDDGNNASGDGCSSSCDVEIGWSCSQGPSHLSPGVAPGDTCSAICGNGIVVSTEACDDGNLRGDDGCTGDCRVEALFECFLPGAAQLLEVPESARTNRGPTASVCVSTKPPRFVGAHFDEAFVSLELNFDSNVAPLPGEEHSGGVATAVPAFPCEVLLDPLTLLLLGDEPSCWWKSRQSAAVAMGGSLGILPGSGVLLKAGVLRSYTFAKEAAPAQEVKADVPGGFIAPVLWPRPIITGAQMAPACADVTVLSSEYSQGFAGRMAMPPRWAVVAAFNMTAASWDSAEVERIQRGMEMQFQDAEVYLPRQGVLLSLLDLEFDRSIRVGFIYRICLRQQNMLDLVGIGCHNLEINELPVPRVVTAVPQHPMALMEGRWLQLEVKAELPQGCVTGDPPRPTTLLAASAPEPTHSLRLEEPLRLVRALWSFDTSLRNALGEAISVPLLSSSRSVGEERYGNRSVASQLFLRPGTLPTGYVNVYSQVCVNASKNLTETETLLGLLPTEEVCGYTTFAVNHLSLPAPPLSLTTERPWRRVAEVGEVLAAAAAGAELRLVGTPPAPGAAPQGPPVEAEVGVDSLALQRLRVLEDVGNNAMRAEQLQYGWLGAVEPEDSTTVLGAILVPPNTSTYAPQLLSKAMAALIPVVTWSVTAATRNGAAVVVEPIASQPSAGGGFLSIGPGQLAPGSQILVEVEMALVPPGDAGSGSCPVPLRTMRQEAVLAVNLPPAAGYLKVEESQANSPLRTLMLENMRWSSEVLPLQYRFEAAHLQAQGERRLFLSDWSYEPKLTVVFLPRTEEKLLLRGQVRDGRGTFAATAPETVQLISSASDESGLRAITEFQQGRMSAADYSSRKVGESIAQIQAAGADLEPLQQLQLWQDVAFAALSDADNITVSNCSKDCGPNGACPEPDYVVMVGNTVVAANASPNTAVSSGERLVQVQSWTRCVCSIGWQGQACESRTFEAQSQELLTKTVTEALQGLLGSAHQLQVLGITYQQGALARLMRLLGRLCEDCRRVSLNVLASITGLAAGLAALPKAALRVAATDTAALMSRIYACLPDEAPSNSMAQMPAPATVLLTALGSSEVCRPINGTNTTVCYDLASSEVQMTCPSAGRQYQADIYLNPSTATSSGVEVSCRANLNLGLSEPYPCPCSVPEGTFLGFGRSGQEPSLSETLGLRNEKDILWRELLKLFWNNTKYGGNGSSIRVPQPGPALAAALWLEETGAPTSEVSAALAQAEHWRLVQQGTLAALQTLGERLVAALLAGVHPGQAARSVDALPMVASWAAPSVMETNASQGRMGIASVPLDSLGTRIELEYQASDETISGTRLPGVLPYKVPLGALRWKNKSHNLYSKMDPSVRVHSDVVQLQLLAESSQTSTSNLTKLRYHFMVPELPRPNRCEALRPTKDRLELCCNASRSSIGSFSDFSCLRPVTSSQSSAAPARRLEDRSGNDHVADERRIQSQAKEAALVQLFGRRVPFQAGLEDLLEDVRIWTASTQPVMLAGTRLRLQGGNMKVQRACDSRGNAAERLLVRAGLLLQHPDAGWSTDAWCRTVFDRARLLQSSVPSWQTFADALLQAAEEVEADPSLVPTSSTVTTSTTTSTTSSTLTGTTSTYTGTQTSNTTTTATSSTSSYSSTASFTSSTHTSSTSTMSRTSTRSLTTTTSLTLSTTSSTDSTTTQNITTSSTTSATTTEIPWCSRGDQAQTDTWCPSGVTLETELPVYADAELADEQGVLLFGVFGVQLSMQGSSALTLGLPPPGQLTLLSTERSLVFLHAMALIYASWIDSWVEAHELSNASYVLRHWAPEPSTLTTSSTTFTGTSSTATTSTTTRPVVAFPQPPAASGAVLSTLEVVFSDPLELLTRALQMDLENNDGLPRLTDSSSSSLAIRGMATSSLLHSWCEVPALAPTQRLADVLAALEPIVLNLNDTTGLRPLHTVLAALEEGLPSEWDASYWSNAPGGPGWEPPLPTATSTTWTSTSTIDMVAVLCPDVECLPPDDCGLDPLMDLECVAWSAPLRRFVPALGCELVAQPGRQWPIVQQGNLEVVCECEAWALHPAMAVASKLPALTPFPPQVQIQTREVAVFWLDKAHSYNLRGLFLPPVLLLLATLHLLLAIYAEVRWRSQARWVAMRTMRAKGVQLEVQQLDAEEKDFIRRRAAEIRATGEFSAAICAAEAQEIVRRAEGLPQASTSAAAARFDIRQAKDGLATLFQAHGLGDVEDDEVRRPPPLALMGPGGLQPPGTTVVTSSLSKATPSLLTPSARMPSATGSPMQALSLRDASLRDAAQEVGFRPEEAMISSKPPTKPRRGLRGMIVDGVRRCRRKHIWRACLTHHKILFLSDDSQTFIFSAPERAAMLHASLWINAVWLSVVLGGFEHRRPFQEPACLRDDEFRLAEVGCLFESASVGFAVLAAALTPPVAGALQTFCRGRSFVVRAKDLSVEDRDRAFTRHFLGPWPSVLMAPAEAKVRVWNVFCNICRFCCPRGCPRPRQRKLLPLHWWPSLVLPSLVLLFGLVAWRLCFYMFHFSTSIYVWETTQTDQPGRVEIQLPPDEQAEASAAGADESWQLRLVLVPEMQRYIVLLAISWFLNLLLFEPLMLILHLFVGEPSVDECLRPVLPIILLVPRAISVCCSVLGKCLDRLGSCLQRFWPERLVMKVRSLCGPCSSCKRWCRLRSCQWCRCKRTEVEPISPPDLTETIESEDEDEASKKDKKGTKNKKAERAEKGKKESKAETT